jgi:sphingolipid delta-4 desaturase
MTIVADAGEFEWVTTDEPHATRQREMRNGSKARAAAPSALRLAGQDAAFRACALLVPLQLFFAWCAADMPWPWAVAFTYLVGGTINHALTLAMHETSHFLAFPDVWRNRAFGVFINLPLGIPAFSSFLRYHRDHHQFQGQSGVDSDIPTVAEGRTFVNAPLKVLWVLLQPAFYALRPLLTTPKRPGAWEAANAAIQVAFDAAVLLLLGRKALFYLVAGTLLGMGLHPMAGHFIAEHYTFLRGQETYSYYGPLNWLSFNVGYHNEHHDVPKTPGSKLPLLRTLAPEFYATLPHHTSWVLVIFQYSACLVGPPPLELAAPAPP